MQVVLEELEFLPKSAEQLIWVWLAASPLDVLRGGGTGGPLVSLSDDWTSLAWLVVDELDKVEVVDNDRWFGVDPSCPGFLPFCGGIFRSMSSSPSLLIPELPSSLKLSDSLLIAKSASSSINNAAGLTAFWCTSEIIEELLFLMVIMSFSRTPRGGCCQTIKLIDKRITFLFLPRIGLTCQQRTLP